LADGLSTSDYRLTITAQDHGGNTAPITDLLYRAPALAVQWSSALRGPQTIVVSVEKPGYEPVLTELAMVCR
jgi:hypothetical protein